MGKRKKHDEPVSSPNAHLSEREYAEDRPDNCRDCFFWKKSTDSCTRYIRSEIVSRRASEVLMNKTGICCTKSCLLAALLRANGIPSGISYQHLTRADEDASEGYIIHALNTVFISELNKWIRLDARGNKENVHAEFSLERLASAFL